MPIGQVAKNSLPNFTSRIQRCFKPTDISRLILIVEINDFDVAFESVDFNDRVNPMISTSNRNPFRFQQ